MNSDLTSPNSSFISIIFFTKYDNNTFILGILKAINILIE